MKTKIKSVMEENIENDPLIQVLSDALRAGPGSPEWRDAITKMNAGEIQKRDEYALLIKTRENLADGKRYREVRAGAGFTRQVMEKINADAAANAKSPLSSSFISYIGAGLVAGVFALILFWLTQAGGAGSGEDLTDLFFNNTLVSASLEGPLPSGWRTIGALTVDPSKGLLPARQNFTSDYAGGGVVTTGGLNAAGPFAVEATFEFQHVSDEMVPQLFVTDDPEFNGDRGVSPHELVWLVRGGQQQVALPDGKLAGSSRKVVDGQSISVRIVVGAMNAVVISDGNVLWTGTSGLASKPRFAGVRLLRRKDDPRSVVTTKQLRVLGK